MTSPRVMRAFLIVVSVYLLSQILREVMLGHTLGCWNWTRIFGLSAFVFSFGLGISAEQRFDDAIQQLREFNTLALTDHELVELKQKMDVEGGAIQFWSGLLIFSIILVTYAAIHANAVMLTWTQWRDGLEITDQRGFVELSIQTLVAVLAAAWSGLFFGRFAHYGALARYLSSAKIDLRIRPDHFDDASGLKPIGDFYLYQALVFSSPAVFLGLWWSIVIPVLQDQSCANIKNLDSWRTAMFFHWIVVMTYFYFGFINPILMLRRRMVHARKWLTQTVAPSVRSQISSLQERLRVGQDDEHERLRMTSHVDKLSEYLWDIRRMSVWPMDAQTRNRFFSLNAFASIAPPLAKLATSTGVILASLPTDSGPVQLFQAVLGSLF